MLHEYISETSQMVEGQVDEYFLRVKEVIEHSKSEKKSKF